MFQRFLIIPALLVILSACSTNRTGDKNHTFDFEMNFSYPGNPAFVFDHLTGDISEWWDHSFSEDPLKIYIEPRPGGGFYEIFDQEGNGALHARVIYADRGKILRMEGPLGLSGQALTLVCTYTLTASGQDSTLLKLNVNASGEFTEETPEVVKQVWEHFLWEQFKPYIEEHYSRS